MYDDNHDYSTGQDSDSTGVYQQVDASITGKPDDDAPGTDQNVEKPVSSKKKAPKSNRITPGERNQRRQLLHTYDFLRETADAEDGESLLDLIADITGDSADDIGIDDLAINLSSLSYREAKTATRGTDFALAYLKSRRDGAGLEESFELGVGFEGLNDDEKDIAKAVLSRVTGADLSELKRSAGGLETLLFLARHPVDEERAKLLKTIRKSDSIIEWK